MRRDAKGQLRQTATEYAEEIRRWGRYSEEQIREAVAYALERGTILPDDPETSATPKAAETRKRPKSDRS